MRRERIMLGGSGKSTDDETTVDIDQLMIDYLNETTDEETDEEREERQLDEGVVRKQKAEDGVANALARKALEEF